MELNDRLRRWDYFSTPISFTHEKSTSYGTLCGGLASILLRIVTLTFFCMRLVTLVGYDDLQISNYVVEEDRG